MKKLILSIIAVAFALNILNAQDALFGIADESNEEYYSMDDYNFDIIREMTSLSRTEESILDSIVSAFPIGLWEYENTFVFVDTDLVEFSIKGDYPGIITVKFEKYNGYWQLCDSVQWKAYQNAGGLSLLREIYINHELEMMYSNMDKDRVQEEDLSIDIKFQEILTTKLVELLENGNKCFSSKLVSLNYLERDGSEFGIALGLSEVLYVKGEDFNILSLNQMKPYKKSKFKEGFLYFVLKKTTEGWVFENDNEYYFYHHQLKLKNL